MHDESPAPGTRDRLIVAMSRALSTRGYHGIGLNELLATANAPKGVLYHHFPGGKAELAVAAIDHVAVRLHTELELISERAQGDIVGALSAWMAAAQGLLESSGYARGCPLATVALETGPDDLVLRAALDRAFTALRGKLATFLMAAGLADARARPLAALLVSAYEGALVQSRVAGDVQPMAETCSALVEVIRQWLPAAAAR